MTMMLMKKKFHASLIIQQQRQLARTASVVEAQLSMSLSQRLELGPKVKHVTMTWIMTAW
jgi:hypothetical protein